MSVGPTPPNAGPMLNIEVATAEIAVKTSTPTAASSRHEIDHEGEIDEVEQALDRRFGHDLAAKPDSEHAMALDHTLELTRNHLEQDQDPRDLHVTGG